MASPVKLIGVFVVIVVVGVAGAVALGPVTGQDAPPDGANISGQSPAQFQPDAVDGDYDPETGEISVDADAESKRILVDTRHSNQFSRSELEPVVEAMFESGHTIHFGHESTGAGGSGSQGPDPRGRERVARGSERPGSPAPGGDGAAGYARTLKQYDGVVIIQPTGDFTPNETRALQNYTEAGGRVVVLGEPTQIEGGIGFFSVPSPVSFGATNLTRSFGVQVGAEMLYNVDDEANDNNFKSVYASPSSDGVLTDGVGTVTFDRAGYVAINDDGEEADRIETLYTAVEGTRTLDTRRDGEYPIAVRNGNMTFVADATFLERSEVYDADNEVFVGNLLEFLVSGDLDEDFPPGNATSGPPRPERHPPTSPEPEPPARTPTPTPTPTNTTSG